MRTTRPLALAVALTALAAAPLPPALAGITLTAASAAAAPTLGMAIMSANVDWDGTLTGGAGALGSVRIESGVYFVAFSRGVEGCTYSAAVGGPRSSTYPGFVSTAGFRGTFNGVNYYGVTVVTADHHAIFGDRPFHLTVFCSK